MNAFDKAFGKNPAPQVIEEGPQMDVKTKAAMAMFKAIMPGFDIGEVIKLGQNVEQSLAFFTASLQRIEAQNATILAKLEELEIAPD